MPIFIELLSSPEADVREQAVWALGNIAGDSPELRDRVLAANALMPLVHPLIEFFLTTDQPTERYSENLDGSKWNVDTVKLLSRQESTS